MVQRMCSVDGCRKPAKTRGMCGMHAERVRRGYGVDGRNVRVPLVPLSCEPAERLWPRIRRADSGCWEWTGVISTAGYGRWGGGQYAHRVVYELLVGPIPDGLDLDHLCRNPACVNPAHLEPVTHAENMRRGSGWSGTLYVRPDRRRSHCNRGHPLSGANLYESPGGQRQCRACKVVREQMARASAEGR